MFLGRVMHAGPGIFFGNSDLKVKTRGFQWFCQSLIALRRGPLYASPTDPRAGQIGNHVRTGD